MMKKKVLFFHFNLGGGGAEKVLINLLNQLNLEKYNITLFTLFGDGVNKLNLRPEIQHKWLFRRTFRGLTPILKFFSPQILHRLLVREYFDVEIAYLENAPTRIVSGCKDSKTKKYAWVHSQIRDLNNFFTPYRSLKEAKKCYASYDKVIFVSKFLQSDFIKKTGWNFLSTQVIYNSMDVDRIHYLASLSSAFEVKRELFNICSVGRLVPVKGFSRLLNVLLKLKSEGFSFHFYLLGIGDLYSELFDFCKQNNMEEYVTFCGYQENPYSLVSQMDLFVCSSLSEGFSTAVVEATLMRIPVLTTDCSGMNEILKEGLLGMIVKNTEDALYNGLKKILEDKNLLKEYKFNLQKEGAIFYSADEVEDLIDM